MYVGIVTAFDLVYLLVNDLFPTIFLATSYGACNVIGRFVSILSPLMAYAPDPIPMLTLIAFSGLCIFIPMCLVKVDTGKGGTDQEKDIQSPAGKYDTKLAQQEVVTQPPVWNQSGSNDEFRGKALSYLKYMQQ